MSQIVMRVKESAAVADECNAVNHAAFAARLSLSVLLQCSPRIRLVLRGDHGTHTNIVQNAWSSVLSLRVPDGAVLDFADLTGNSESRYWRVGVAQ